MPISSIDTDYVWIQEAAKEFDRSRAWLDEQVRQGRLTVAKFEGDRRVYLRRSELKKMLTKPIAEGRRGEHSEHQEAKR
jgi:hypothetical protein